MFFLHVVSPTSPFSSVGLFSNLSMLWKLGQICYLFIYFSKLVPNNSVINSFHFPILKMSKFLPAADKPGHCSLAFKSILHNKERLLLLNMFNMNVDEIMHTCEYNTIKKYLFNYTLT